MSTTRRIAFATPLMAALAIPALGTSAGASSAPEAGTGPTVRFATFNASLNRTAEGELVSDLSTPGNAQARAIAEIIQRTRPDVLLVNEFDYVAGGRAADLFRRNYLQVPQNGAGALHYPYAYVAPSNTGIPSGFDLDNSGDVGGPNDAYGFGSFPGQYGMLVLSKYPIDTASVRTFAGFLWKDMPGAKLPDDPQTPEPADWFSPAELDVVRLSSKSHWDVPIRIGGRTVHFLTSHPTPPVFDGEEDRNGTRNHDEIRFWADYIVPGARSAYIYDDRGGRGGLKAGDQFVIAGDQNSDPRDGDSIPGAIQQLTKSARINNSVVPSSGGAWEASRLQGGVNLTHRSPARQDTADFAEPPGNVRADYVLPSRDIAIVKAQVFWPLAANPLSRLTGTFPFPSSDHRLVWIDARLP